MAQGPQQTDPTERKQVIGITLVLFVILCVWESVGGVFTPLLLIANLIVAAAIALGVQRLTLGFATGLVGKIYAAGEIPPAPSFSLQESMIIRGRYEEAAESFRNHIAEHPEDHHARLALARLLEEHLRDYSAAERLYMEVRRSQPPPDPNQEMAASNGLIDLCRKAGWVERLRVELGRFADRYRGSPAAAAALRELREFENAAPTSESPRSPT